MKHIKLVSGNRQVAQVNPNFQAKVDFMVNLTDQAIEYVFYKTS